MRCRDRACRRTARIDGKCSSGSRATFCSPPFWPEQIAKRKEIAELLPDEERELKIELKTSRRTATFLSILNANILTSNFNDKALLSVNRRVSVQAIYTTYLESTAGLSFKIQDSKGIDLDLKMKNLVKNGKRYFSFDPPFLVEPNARYLLAFKGHGLCSFKLSDLLGDQPNYQHELNRKGWVSFNLDCPPGYHHHCVKGLNFLSD